METVDFQVKVKNRKFSTLSVAELSMLIISK